MPKTGKVAELRDKEPHDVSHCTPVQFLSVTFIGNQIADGELLPWLLRFHISPVDRTWWCVLHLHSQPGSDTLKRWVDICVRKCTCMILFFCFLFSVDQLSNLPERSWRTA